MRSLHRGRLWIAGLMLVLAWFQVFNQALFSHTHILNGGYVIHAHPLAPSSDKSPVKEHDHGKCLLFLENLGVASFIAEAVEVPALLVGEALAFGYSQPSLGVSLPLSDSNRVPPAA